MMVKENEMTLDGILSKLPSGHRARRELNGIRARRIEAEEAENTERVRRLQATDAYAQQERAVARQAREITNLQAKLTTRQELRIEANTAPLVWPKLKAELEEAREQRDRFKNMWKKRETAVVELRILLRDTREQLKAAGEIADLRKAKGRGDTIEKRDDSLMDENVRLINRLRRQLAEARMLSNEEVLLRVESVEARVKLEAEVEKAQGKCDRLIARDTANLGRLIESQAEVKRLRELLQPFAEYGEWLDAEECEPTDLWVGDEVVGCTVRDFLNAHDALDDMPESAEEKNDE